MLQVYQEDERFNTNDSMKFHMQNQGTPYDRVETNNSVTKKNNRGSKGSTEQKMNQVGGGSAFQSFNPGEMHGEESSNNKQVNRTGSSQLIMNEEEYRK